MGADKDPIQELILLRQRAREFDELPRGKKKRHTMSRAMRTIVLVPDSDREMFLQYWQNVPKTMTVEEVIACKTLIQAMGDGKVAIEAAKFAFNTAYGLDSVDSEIEDTYQMPILTKEVMEKFKQELDKQY